jgi:hypothetical protein
VTHDHFDEPVAERYDDVLADMFDPRVVDPAVDFLAELAGDGMALELGIGTGRIALPLTRRGVTVHGIDLSSAMVARLREKPDGDRIPVVLGDFATASVAGTFRVAYLVFNTIMNLTTQEQQVKCFENVGSHLEPGGWFVVEVGVPQLQRLPPSETLTVFTMTADHVGLDQYDVATQGLVSHHYRRRGDQFDLQSFPFRYVWPSELDLMARIAGMTLANRWGGWNREPFTADSDRHVSVWQKLSRQS